MDKSSENPLPKKNITLQESAGYKLTPYPQENKGDLSLIKEKAEPESNNISKTIKTTNTKMKRITLRNNHRTPQNNELQNKLEKALNELKDCKDKFWQQKETPIKPSTSTYGGLYSPSNRLKSAPYPFNNMFSTSFYSTMSGQQQQTIYTDGEKNFMSAGNDPNTCSPAPPNQCKSKPTFDEILEGKKPDVNFTIDLNGIPHSVYTSGTDTAGTYPFLVIFRRHHCSCRTS